MANNIKITPLVSVLMTVHNGEKYIEQAVQSILNQEYKFFEFIIIDDASTDSTVSLIKNYKDSRIKLTVLRSNQGVANASNIGLRKVKGAYIARMDSDDISLPSRLKDEVEFMESNPDVSVVGTGYGIITSSGKLLQLGPVIIDSDDIKTELLFRNSFIHGSTMLRVSFLEKNKFLYQPNSLFNEDYDLWLRIRSKAVFHNIPKVLYLWRINPEGLTATNFNRMKLHAQYLSDYWRKHKMISTNIGSTIQKIEIYKNNTLTYKGKKYSDLLLKNYQYFLLKSGQLHLSLQQPQYFFILSLLALLAHPWAFFSLFKDHIEFLIIKKQNIFLLKS